MYRQTPNISHHLKGNQIVHHSDVASPDGHSRRNIWIQWIGKSNYKQDEKHLTFDIWCPLYERFDGRCNESSHYGSGKALLGSSGKLEYLRVVNAGNDGIVHSFIRSDRNKRGFSR